VLAGFNNILNQAGGCDIFVACHGGSITAIMDYLYPNEKNFYEWQPKPGRGYTLVYTSGGLELYKII